MKKLQRSQNEKIILGVCGGVANYFEIDPVIVRIIFALLLVTGSGFFLYLIMALIMPKEDSYV
jgi:phage shock protein C